MTLRFNAVAWIVFLCFFSKNQLDGSENWEAKRNSNPDLRNTHSNTIENNVDEIIGRQLLNDYSMIYAFSPKMKKYNMNRANFEKLFREGLEKAFCFHQSENHFNQSNINQIVEEKLSYSLCLKHALKRPSINTIEIDKSVEVLNSFSGQWHGKWQSMNVRHLWLPTRKCNSKYGFEYKIIGFQTCFTGDGFGWNYLIQKDGKTIILGHVYHFDEHGILDYENPHYAFLNNQKQLTWISDTHIYYEFVCTNRNCRSDNHYVITALPYSNESAIKFGSPHQAIYRAVNKMSEL